jgi:hypothetical protein
MTTGTTLDLNGDHLTLSAGDVLSLYQVTDTSADHDGTLEMDAGSDLIFDDVRYAGFSSVASAMTLDLDGTIAAQAVIEVEDIKPDYPWRLPADTATVSGDFGVMIDSQGFKGTAWSVDNWEFVDTRSLQPGTVGGLKEVVTIEPWSGAYDGYGKRAYGAAVAVHCHIMRRPTMVIDAQGREDISSVQVHIDGNESAEVTSRLTLPGGDQPVIKSIGVHVGPGGRAHSKVIYA